MRAARGQTQQRDERLGQIIQATRQHQVTAHDLVLASLRIAILEGVLAPGARLRQEELAGAFRTSRIPVREALRALEYEGLVTSEPHRGFTVTTIDGDDVDEIYELRILLEGEAVRLAVPLLTDADLDDLEGILESIRQSRSPDEEIRSRDRFYLRLYSVSGRPRLVGLIVRLRDEGARMLAWSRAEHIVTIHERLLAALRAGDAEGATQLLAEHYARMAGQVRRSLREAAPGARVGAIAKSR
jgi:DNA-binding GntR family transcriptional regulator